MTLTRRRISSAQDMKALAHPLRLTLLDLLASRGPLTATEAAAALEQTPANVSWHLRRLAEQGFVRSMGRGPGRQRPWKAVTEAFDGSELLGDQSVGAAGSRRFRLLLTDAEAARLAADIGAVVAAYEAQAVARSVPGRRPVAVLVEALEQ